MQSILIISKNKEKIDTYIQDFCKKQKIEKFDVHHITSDESSLGIAIARNIQKLAIIKPIQSALQCIIVDHAELLTVDAQNALLKLLEEPPQSAGIFLCSASDTLLPTIVSRCKVIQFEQKTETISEEDQKEYEEFFSGEKLFWAEKLAANKEGLIPWLEKGIVLIRKKMLENPEEKIYAQTIIQLQKALRFLQTTNVSPREILEHTFLAN